MITYLYRPLHTDNAVFIFLLGLAILRARSALPVRRRRTTDRGNGFRGGAIRQTKTRIATRTLDLQLRPLRNLWGRGAQKKKKKNYDVNKAALHLRKHIFHFVYRAIYHNSSTCVSSKMRDFSGTNNGGTTYTVDNVS